MAEKTSYEDIVFYLRQQTQLCAHTGANENPRKYIK